MTAPPTACGRRPPEPAAPGAGRELPGLEEAVLSRPWTAYGVGGLAEFLCAPGRPACWCTPCPCARARRAGHRARPLHRRARRRRRRARPDGARAQRGHDAAGHVLRAEAGGELPGQRRRRRRAGLVGLTFVGNIPGSIGAPWSATPALRGVDQRFVAPGRPLEEGKEHAVQPDHLGFGFCTSMLKSRPDIVVLSAAFQLRHSHRDELARASPTTPPCGEQGPARVRQPAAATSRPSRETPAARLIEDASQGACALGRAHVSESM